MLTKKKIEENRVTVSPSKRIVDDFRNSTGVPTKRSSVTSEPVSSSQHRGRRFSQLPLDDSFRSALIETFPTSVAVEFREGAARASRSGLKNGKWKGLVLGASSDLR